MMEVVILSGADADLDEIYARLRNGERFLIELDRKLEFLRTFPLLFPTALMGKIRKARIGTTPYGIFYSIESNRLMVIAIQDLRQDPDALVQKILSRL